jgi:5'-3' exonuclease
MDKILIIDGNNFIWRANIGFKPKDGSTSDFTIVYNFFRNLKALISNFSPDSVFFVLEGHPKFRYEILSSYKANRKIIKTGSENKKQDFNDQSNIIVDLLKYLPIHIAKAKDYECDDVIATLAENLKEEQVTVVSNDSDFIQLLQKNYKYFKLYNPMKKEYVQAPEYPYTIWKSLNGDKSDNIPKLLSDAKALKTINDPKLLESFLSVEENRANFSINRSLIEFQNIPEDQIMINQGSFEKDILKESFQKMEFESMLTEKYWSAFCEVFDAL